MKRFFAVILLLALLIGSACAYSYDDYYDCYIITSTLSGQYAYMYDRPSSSEGRNLGAYSNDTVVKAIDYNASSSFAFVITPDGKTGYIGKSYLTYMPNGYMPVDLYMVFSTSPAGYCYMYDKPSSSNGKNLGRYDNYDAIEIINWDADKNYALVRGLKNGKYGYVAKSSLIEQGQDPFEGYCVVTGDYIYVYDRASSYYGKNLGSYKKGAVLAVIDWDADKNYAQIMGLSDNKIGYVAKDRISLIYD